MDAQPETVTRLLQGIDSGDAAAHEQLSCLVYDELRRIAGGLLARSSQATYQPTDLVHEAYMRLVLDRHANWANRRHFYCAAAKAVRHLLVDRARARRAAKRGGNREPITLAADLAAGSSTSIDVLALHEALDRLAKHDDHLVELVELRYFAGLSVDQAAHVRGISRRSAERGLHYAKAWLYRCMAG